MGVWRLRVHLSTIVGSQPCFALGDHVQFNDDRRKTHSHVESGDAKTGGDRKRTVVH
jgi:hypothetical protein